MPSKADILGSGLPYFIGWVTSVLGVLICLIAAEYTVLGSFSWNYEPEVDLLISQNATTKDIEMAKIRARDVADMRIISLVVISIVAATFFMALLVWRLNAKDLAAKEKIEIEWRNSRNEIKSISQSFGMILELLVYGSAHLTPLESKKASEFLQKFRLGDPQCSLIFRQMLTLDGTSDFSQMDPEAKTSYAIQKIRGILSDFENDQDGSSLYSETYYSICEGSF